MLWSSKEQMPETIIAAHLWWKRFWLSLLIVGLALLVGMLQL